ncbi:MAG: ABC transporter ATP-binding protein [Euryarchaeota archaeon]|nr:ABC transporter ATP-binding protein [Euryarchaeota archaeon]
MSALVAASGLAVRYGKVRALLPTSFEIPKGTWALLGPNGAGKSTLIRAMLGLTQPSQGSVFVLGKNPAADPAGVRRRVGYMPESPALLPGLTGIQYVTLAAKLSGMNANAARRAAHVTVDDVGLGEARYRKVETYSTGMRNRVKLAQALVHDPELIILDEPTNGLDPDGRDAMLDLIRDLKGEGRSLLMSSHILPEVRKVCDQAVILREGKVLHKGPLEDLAQDLGGVVLEPLDAPEALVRDLKGQGLDVETVGDRIIVHGTDAIGPILATAHRAGVAIRSAKPHSRAVHDVIVEYMEGEVGA